MQVEHVDFVSVLTQDLQRAKRFYVETLGLEVETEGDSDMELRCGQVTLDVFDPSSIGQPFAPSPAGVALRVADVDAARAELESKGVVFDGDTIVTGVCKQALVQGSGRERADAPPEVRRMTRTDLLERYRALPLPTTKDESWRFTDLKGFDPETFSANGATDVAAAPGLLELEAAGVVRVSESGSRSTARPKASASSRSRIIRSSASSSAPTRSSPRTTPPSGSTACSCTSRRTSCSSSR